MNRKLFFNPETLEPIKAPSPKVNKKSHLYRRVDDNQFIDDEREFEQACAEMDEARELQVDEPMV